MKLLTYEKKEEKNRSCCFIFSLLLVALQLFEKMTQWEKEYYFVSDA